MSKSEGGGGLSTSTRGSDKVFLRQFVRGGFSQRCSKVLPTCDCNRQGNCLSKVMEIIESDGRYIISDIATYTAICISLSQVHFIL